MPSKFWNFVANADNTADLNLYGEIMSDEPWYTEDYTYYGQFIKELEELGARNTIRVHINSGGGDVFAAHAIFTRLKMNQAKIIALIEGICASAATIVAASADVIKAAPNALLMFHNNRVGLYGYYDTEDLVKLAEINREVKQSIIESYRTKYNKTEEELNILMDEESWMTGREALQQGYVDELLFDEVTNVMKGNAVFVNNITNKRTTVCNIQDFKNFPLNLINKTASADFIEKDIQSKGDNEEMEIKTTDDLRNAYPTLVNQIIEEVTDNVIAEERNRIQEIDKLSGVAPADMLNLAKYEKPMQANDLALQIMMANSALGQQELDNIKNDIKNSGAGSVGAGDQELTKEELTKNKVKNLAGFLNKDTRRA